MSFRWEAQGAILGAMSENELAAASRDELIALIRQLAAAREHQQTVIAALQECRVWQAIHETFSPRNMP
jgi:hypothetical protein